MNMTNRYEAIGIEYPNPDTMCIGDCEGTGFYPVQSVGFITDFGGIDFRDEELWQVEHNKGNFFKRILHKLTCDGWHFVKCYDCKGTGKRKINQ